VHFKPQPELQVYTQYRLDNNIMLKEEVTQMKAKEKKHVCFQKEGKEKSIQKVSLESD
jgi:cell fate (sporulation/competence/biofilm development) regulator YmcA (YheA/YmcA/DUF963 family)